MKINNEATGTGNVNSSREAYNDNVSKLRYLGKTKRFGWNLKRSFRSF